MIIPFWQRFIAFIVYLLPWSDAIPFGNSLFIELPYLRWLALPTLPIIILERIIPFGSLLIFILLFVGIVRNQKISYFLRFNTLQAILIDIGIIFISFAFEILITPIGNGLILRTISSTILIAVLTIVIYATIECIQGKEPDLPGISSAVRIQL